MKFSFGIATLALVLASSGIALAGTGDTGMGAGGAGEKMETATYKLGALNASGQTGTVSLVDKGAKGTLVTIALTGEPSSAIEPAHIHTGSCGPSLGGVKWGLTNVVGGKSETLVPQPFSSVNASGLAVNVHKSAAQITHYVACANIK